MPLSGNYFYNEHINHVHEITPFVLVIFPIIPLVLQIPSEVFVLQKPPPNAVSESVWSPSVWSIMIGIINGSNDTVDGPAKSCTRQGSYWDSVAVVAQWSKWLGSRSFKWKFTRKKASAAFLCHSTDSHNGWFGLDPEKGPLSIKERQGTMDGTCLTEMYEWIEAHAEIVAPVNILLQSDFLHPLGPWSSDLMLTSLPTYCVWLKWKSDQKGWPTPKFGEIFGARLYTQIASSSKHPPSRSLKPTIAARCHSASDCREAEMPARPLANCSGPRAVIHSPQQRRSRHESLCTKPPWRANSNARSHPPSLLDIHLDG